MNKLVVSRVDFILLFLNNRYNLICHTYSKKFNNFCRFDNTFPSSNSPQDSYLQSQLTSLQVYTTPSMKPESVIGKYL